MDVLERKVRPIYEALDAGNPKQALALCNKNIKKSDTAPIFKALKALSLERLDKPDEAFQLCNEVRATGSMDEGVLQAVALVYRARARHMDLVSMYEAAYTKRPSDEELANHWFMSLVRSGINAKELQQSAIKLNKHFTRTDRYMFWIIMTIYLQGLPPTSKQSSASTPAQAPHTSSMPANMFYSLAERMIGKAISDSKMKDQEQLLLYLMILESQAKYQEALDVLKSDLGKLCAVPSEWSRLVSGLNRRLERWDELRDVGVECLGRNSDDWDSYVNYLDATFQKKKIPIDEAKALIQQYQQATITESPRKPQRGPFLAELELLIRLIAKSKEPSSSLVAPALNYFERFGVTYSCFDDLRPALNNLSTADASKLIESLCEKYDSGTFASVSEKIDQCKRQVNIRKIERLAIPIPVTSPLEVFQQVDLMMSRYDDALKLGTDLTEKERQYGDDYLSLACHYLIDLYEGGGDIARLFESASLLEIGLKKSKYNFQFKIMLICIYRELGVYVRALDVASTLEVKQIMYDTLSYIYNDDIESFGILKEGTSNVALRSLLRSLTIYSNNERETPEMIVQAFKFGTFSKIPEFINFRDRLRNSIQRAICHRQIVRIEVLRRWNVDKASLANYFATVDAEWMTDDAVATSYSDNRDITIMADWNANGKTASIASRIRRGREARRSGHTWLKLYTLIPRILKSISAGSVSDPAFVASRDALEMVVEEAGKSQDPDILCEYKVARVVLSVARLQEPIKEGNGTDDTNAIVSEIMGQVKDLLNACSHYKEEPVIVLSQDWLRDCTLLLEIITYILVSLQSQSTKKTKSKAMTFSGPFAQLSDPLKSITIEFESILSGLLDKLKKQTKVAMMKALYHGESTPPRLREEGAKQYKEEVISHVCDSWIASVESLRLLTLTDLTQLVYLGVKGLFAAVNASDVEGVGSDAEATLCINRSMSSTIVPESGDFGINNIPFGIISTASNPTPRPATILGHHVVDIKALADANCFNGPLLSSMASNVFSKPTLNEFMGLTRPHWIEARTTIQNLLTGVDDRLKRNPALMSKAVIPVAQTQSHLPSAIGDYTDFYASKEHAFNAGSIFRGPEQAIQPNWFHIPIGYHGRASSIVVSGTPIRRPNGLIGAMTATPTYSACKKLDIELELAFFIGGPANALGDPIPIAKAEDRLFGFVLLNDWSARDIQAFEYVPLGPFLGKNFGSSISPWIVTLEALEAYKRPQPTQTPQPSAYLQDPDSDRACYDIELEVHMQPSGSTKSTKVLTSNYKYLYWSPRQMIAHHSVGGCNLQPGDMCGTGTISGPNKGEMGSFLERSWNGRDAFEVHDGIKRTFLEDGDEVTFTAHVAPGVGFGECSGVILPAHPLSVTKL
ncbi:fumarylacetoacetase [Synchytrium microbalum]|uniref:fumarylacetoacetase n=1 Tax=Synchytrium microbalum TaxID=1806994 RepID=A0A507C304_9FUNG|nr:fumarylacetoacetase [Synchytrium microbalum]TPX33748.1 fumarylacetoacetase [Synchytrium microbalum]